MISLRLYTPKSYYGEEGQKEKLINFEINPGYTALVGPNGTGKSTMLKQIVTYCEEHKYSYLLYDNLRDGRQTTMQEALMSGHMEDLFAHMCSSEGEGIIHNIGNFASKVGRMCYKNSLRPGEKMPVFILLDGIDSGMSIDKLWTFRHDFADFIIAEELKNRNPDLYIITTANNYELANNGADCINVINGKHIKFKTYDAFEKFIFKNSKEEFLNGKPQVLSKTEKTKSNGSKKTNRAEN